MHPIFNLLTPLIIIGVVILIVILSDIFLPTNHRWAFVSIIALGIPVMAICSAAIYFSIRHKTYKRTS